MIPKMPPSGNRLAAAASAYLQSAAHQPIHWFPWERRGLRCRARRGSAGAARHRRGVVPLVPRDGRRVVRGPRARRLPQRALRLHQGGSGRAARRGRALPARGAGAHPSGRLAADRVPHARRARCSTAAPTSRPTARTAGPGSGPCSRACSTPTASRRGQVESQAEAIRRVVARRTSTRRRRARRSLATLDDGRAPDVAGVRSGERRVRTERRNSPIPAR